MDRRLQVWLAVFFAVLVFVILVHPAIDLPDGTAPQKYLAGIVVVSLVILAMVAASPAILFTLEHIGLLFRQECALCCRGAASSFTLRC